MNEEKLKSCCLDENSTIADILAVLDSGVFGIALVVDGMGSLVGIVTDGDVRRSIMKGATLTDLAQDHMNRNFTVSRQSDGHQAALALLSENRRHIPIIDEQRRPVDMVSLTEIWKLSVASPSLAGNEIKYVADCLASGWISSQGEYVKKFEKSLADYCGVSGVLAVTNGTSALQLAITALNIGPGDEVLVPNLTFGATANAVIHSGATPVFVDVDPQYWCIDTKAISAAITPKTRAIIPVHLYGHPADMGAIMELAKAHDLYVIEDCAEAIGAKVDGVNVGTIGDVGCFSFFANKIITTGEGGAVVSRHRHVIERMRILMNHGMDPDRRYWHLMPGFNFRMTNMQAEIGLAQMERIEQFLATRTKLAQRYSDGLDNLDWLILPQTAVWAERVQWLYSITVTKDAPISRDQLIERLNTLNIETREVFPPLNIQPAFGDTARQLFPVSSKIAASSLSLPTSVEMSDTMVDHVIAAIRQIEQKSVSNTDL